LTKIDQIKNLQEEIMTNLADDASLLATIKETMD